MALLDEIRKAQVLNLLGERLQGLLDVPTSAARFMASPTGILDVVSGKTAMPREKGFAEGATGLPQRENLTVLDPANRAYMEGYSQGEPFGYAAMALPFASAGATKLSDKLVQTITKNPSATAMNVIDYASMPFGNSITAYHGSPYKFDKFDVSKIGSGEGQQAYGHGLYFAENPKIAESYKKTTSFTKYIDKATGEIVDVRDLPKEKLADLSKNYKEYTGNLYKVDIPDEKIPTMMDWDKRLGEQSDFVKKAINNLKKQVTPEMKDELGGDLNLLFGKDITPSQFLNTWEIIHPTGGVGIGEKLLNEQGVKGIRYLDNTSRDAGKGTFNFVVFDPTDVKILERNDKPIESLLGK